LLFLPTSTKVGPGARLKTFSHDVTELSLHLSVSVAGEQQAHRPTSLKKSLGGGGGGLQAGSAWFCD